jgi:hypothetical protein
MFYKIIPLILFSFYADVTYAPEIKFETIEIVSTVSITIEEKAENSYNNLITNNFKLPTKESFTKAFEGYFELKEKGFFQKEILTIIDYNLSSNVNRLWIIDLKNNSILLQSLVAHGRNSGEEYANNFSNTPESYKSSLGFFVTGETYVGKHGYSLRLDGVEKKVNSNARDRAIVVHGADYVSEKFINQNGRLGRSLGCFALPQELKKEIIDLIKDKSCLFAYYSS